MAEWTVDDVLVRLPATPGVPRLPAPKYTWRGEDSRVRVALAVEAMRRHMTDEGWQIMDGLRHAGYSLAGRALDTTARGKGGGETVRSGLTDAQEILDFVDPGVVVVQDKREWDGLTAGGLRDRLTRFKNVGALRLRPDVFKLTVVKDAQHRPVYHSQSADEMGCHAWITYYHPRVVTHLAPYVRPEHLVRTYHTVDRDAVPLFESGGRRGVVVSGAVSNAYPLRSRLVRDRKLLPDAEVVQHPGYHQRGCETPRFLRTLSGFRVAVCTASLYGYALRKIVEATACGCRVLTDLPHDDPMPEIDGNLVRVRPDATTGEVARTLRRMVEEWDPRVQLAWAARAVEHYDFRAMGERLAADVERVRAGYTA